MFAVTQTGSARGAAGAAQHNRPLPLSDFRHRTEGEDTPPPREETATADDDLVGVVSVPLVAEPPTLVHGREE